MNTLGLQNREIRVEQQTGGGGVVERGGRAWQAMGEGDVEPARDTDGFITHLDCRGDMGFVEDIDRAGESRGRRPSRGDVAP